MCALTLFAVTGPNPCLSHSDILNSLVGPNVVGICKGVPVFKKCFEEVSSL